MPELCIISLFFPEVVFYARVISACLVTTDWIRAVTSCENINTLYPRSPTIQHLTSSERTPELTKKTQHIYAGKGQKIVGEPMN